MVSVTSTPAGTGIASMLQSVGSSSSSTALYSAISGSGSTDKTATKLFNSICPGSTTSSIDDLLTQKKVATQKNAIFANVATRLTAMQAGTYTASADWEKVASYAMETGQPVAITLDSKGQIQAVTQSQADLSTYNVQQQKQLTAAMTDIATMADKINANKKNQSLIDKLNGAESDLMGVYQSALTSQTSTPNDWEANGVMALTLQHPFTISLDSNGDLQVEDQMTATFSDLNTSQQKIMRAALSSLDKAVKTGEFTELWQADAMSLNEAGVPYHLEIDNETNEIKVIENNGDNIMPDFLKETPYPNVGDNTKLLKQAKTLITAGKAFFLDFDQSGQLTAKEATAQNLIKFNATKTTTSDPLGVGSILNLFA